MPEKIELEPILKRWQAALSLQDWFIAIRYARFDDIEMGTGGTIDWVTANKSAIIKILDPNDYPPDAIRPLDIEKTVLHELVHLVHENIRMGVTCGDEHVSYVIKEQEIERLTWALINTARMDAKKQVE